MHNLQALATILTLIFLLWTSYSKQQENSGHIISDRLKIVQVVGFIGSLTTAIVAAGVSLLN